MFEKIDVKGKNIHPLYKYLTHAAPGFLNTKAVKWNFTKFLTDKNGKVIKRFSPKTDPEKIVPFIDEMLSQAHKAMDNDD